MLFIEAFFSTQRTQRNTELHRGLFGIAVTFTRPRPFNAKITVMKQIIFSFMMAMMALSSATAQTKVIDAENAEKRTIGSFHAIETSAGIEVIITKGDKEELAVTVGDKQYLDEVRTVVENGTLKISRKGDWDIWRKWKNWKIKVYVSYTRLDEVKATSGGSISGTDVKLDRLSARINSGGWVSLAGSVESLEVDGNSGAQFKGYSLSTVNCKADVSSGAGVQVTVTKEISARASSGGFIRFKGDGLIRDINVNSGGAVKRG